MELSEIHDILKPEKYVGRAVNQVIEFVEEDVKPVLEKNKDLIGYDVTLKV